jgi:hypothetical protein
LERYTNVRNCRSLDELRLIAERYFGDKWRPTDRQEEALIDEAKRRGYFERWELMEKQRELPWYAQGQPQVSATRRYRREIMSVRGKSQVRYRDLKTGRFIKKP